MDDVQREILLRTFVIGLVVAAPVGAMGVLCMQRTLARGWPAGLATGAGIATADAMYAAVAAFGLAAVSTWMVDHQAILRILGGIVLVYLGWTALRGGPPERGTGDGQRGLPAMYATAVGLTLTNPLTIMAFAAVFAGAGLVMEPGSGTAATATVGVALGSFAWWVVLTTIVVLVRHAISDRVLVIIDRVAGSLLIALGALAVVAGVWSST